jgi:hypothetical protein
LLYHLVSAGQEKPGMAVQGSFALMGDRRPYSLVFCHAHGAQILEFRWLAVPGRFCRAFGVGRRSRNRYHLPAIVHSPLKGAKFRPFQPNGNEAFLKKFPQAAPD